MRAYLVICVTFFSLAAVVIAVAAEKKVVIEPIQLQKAIKDINRLKPLQNPRHEQSGEILDRHILDSASKVVGEVDDVIINTDGTVTSLLIQFDRLRLSQPVSLNYETFDIESVSAGYRLGFDKKEIKKMYPFLLSSIEVAAGEDAQYYSTKELIGSKVVTSGGFNIGKLDDILFDQSGTYVRSIYLNINYQAIHEKGLAVPLSILEFGQKDGHIQIVIDQKYADLIIQYVKDS